MQDPPSKLSPDETIVLFDGVCNLCDGVVQFLIKRDRDRHFRFASLQSNVGSALLATHGLDPDQRDTVVVIDAGKAYGRSDAALRLAKKLGGLWRVLTVFGLIPRPVRDVLYDFIAARRYRWFGHKDQCMLPTPENRSRFLDDGPAGTPPSSRAPGIL